MSCIVAPIIQNPFLHNKVIQTLQADLQTGCSWLDIIYPLAEVGEREIEGNRVTVPVCYGQKAEGENNYIELFPNSELRAGCFFELPSGEFEENRIEEEITYEISLIVWANLNLLASRDYDFTDELISSVRNALNVCTYKNDITGFRFTRDKNKVFERYGYSFQNLYSFMYPQTAFKVTFTFTMNSDADCFSPSSFDTSFSPIC